MLARTVLKIVTCEMKAAEAQIHRILDDTACVAQASLPETREFASVYHRVAKQLGIQLAAECPDKDKAFTDSTWGTVLGIVFNTEILCWRMPPHKVEELLVGTGNFIRAGNVSLEETQKVEGRINHLVQMLLFLRAFRRPLNGLLGEFEEDENILLPVSKQQVADLKLCANTAMLAMNWLPIPQEHVAPPANTLVCV
jgi:hypothetical protein